MRLRRIVQTVYGRARRSQPEAPRGAGCPPRRHRPGIRAAVRQLGRGEGRAEGAGRARQEM